MNGTLDLAWGIQAQVLQAREMAEFRGLRGDDVVTWMTRRMWDQLINEVMKASPWVSTKLEPDQKARYEYCGCEVRFFPGNALVSFSAHPKFLR